MIRDIEPIIEARRVEKLYLKPDGRSVQVVAPIDLQIFPGKIYALLGPSGCGKSSLLRILSGLAQPSRGQVLSHGYPLDGQLPNVQIVFQTFALFPWLTVIQNVEAPLRAAGVQALERHKRSLRMLDIVGLDGFESAYPKELSGGMKQRVGFARALVVEPELLFMDEPFSALDVLTAESLRGELLELWLEKKIPTRAIFMVTHNIDEAVFLADQIIVLGNNPAQIVAAFDVRFAHPRNRKAAAFLNLVDQIYTAFTRSRLPAGAAPAHSRDAAPMTVKVLALPHARPGGIAGLLEILTDRGGRHDLYKLADTLAMEVDDLLPIVEAGVLLGFIRVHEGDVEMTQAGIDFAHADILNRKTLFRQAAIDNVPLLRQIQRALQSKTDHTLPYDFFYGILDEHFSNEIAMRQIDTAIEWGRYAELFDYDAETQRLMLTES